MAKFQAINWTPNEVMAESKMDLMTENAEYLFTHTPRALYTLPGGLRRIEGVRIAAGRIVIPKKKDSDSASAQVRFGNFFSIRSEPIITTGIVAQHQTKIFCTTSGIGGKLQPDHRGFSVHVNIDAGKAKKDKILRSFYVTWQAMGY